MATDSSSFGLTLSSKSGRKYIGATKNVLDEYRSYTYNFTLAALKADSLKDPNSYRSSSLDFVILKSGGKSKGMNPDAVVNPVTEIASGETKTSANTAEIVKSFNQRSAGRFDFFMDGLEVETIMVPTEETGSALATKIRFEVIEPYSMNGFIDALRVSAISSGHLNYISALFLLKVEFKGYPDSDSFTNAETIDYATRYFPIRFTGIEVTVTEQGTKYTCTAVPYNEIGMSSPNTIIADIKMSGKKVGEILDDMIKSLNEKIDEKTAAEKDPELKKNKDRYEIYFPKLSPGESITSESVKKASRNDDLWNADINKFLSENNVFKFPDPTTGYNPGNNTNTDSAAAASDPNLSEDQKKELLSKQQQQASEDSRNPDKVAISFASGASIHDIITAVIRDSSYVRKILQDVNAAKDSNGMINYFKIHLNTVPETIDTTHGYRLHTYQFIVLPYKIHYTKLPGQKFTANDPEKLAPLIKREYEYIYTGNNLQVLGFNLKFNTLYFQSASPLAGNVTNQGSAQAAVATNVVKTNNPSNASQASAENKTPSPPLQSDINAAGDNKRALPKSDDPFYTLAYAAHKSILESVDMIKAEMDILGDPYYLVTGGAGNFIPPADETAMTKDGEANIQSAEPLVKFSFRNPIDIDYNTGLMTFDTVVEYSGVYRVIKAQSTLKDGVFKQHLTMIRIPGQFEGKKKISETAFSYATQPNVTSQIKTDTASPDIQKAGVKPNDFDLTKLTGAVQKASGVVSQGINAINKLNEISGFNLVDSNLSSTIDKVASGTRLAESGLSTVAGIGSLAASALSNPQQAMTNIAGNVTGALNNITGNLTNLKDTALSGINSIGDKLSSITAGTDKLALTNKLGIDASAISGLGGKLESSIIDQVKSLTGNLPKGVDLATVKKTGVILGNLSKNAIKNLPATTVKLSVPEPDIPLADSLGGEAYVSTLAKEISAKQAAELGETSVGSSLPNTLDGSLSKLSNAASSAASKLPNISDPVAKNDLVSSVTGKLDDVSSVASNIPKTSDLTSKVPNAASIGGAADSASKLLSESANSVNTKELASQFGSLSSAADSASNTIKNATKGSTEGKLSSLKSLSASELKSKLESYTSVAGINTDNLFGADGKVNLSAIPTTPSIPSLTSDLGSGVAGISDLSKSVSNQFGSIDAGTSPLTDLMKKQTGIV